MNMDPQTVLTTIACFIAGAAAVQLGLKVDTKREKRKASYVELSHYFAEMGFDFLPDLLGKVAINDLSGTYETVKKAANTFRDPDMRKVHLLKLMDNMLANPDVLTAVKAKIKELTKAAAE